MVRPAIGTANQAAAHLHAASHAADLEVADAVLRGLSRSERASQLALVRQIRLDAVVRELYADAETTLRRPGREISSRAVELLRLSTDLRLPTHVNQAVNLLAALATGDKSNAPAVLADVTPVVDRLLASLGETAHHEIERLGSALRRALTRTNSIHDFWHHSQLFKGIQFTAVVRTAGPFELLDSWDASLETVLKLEAAAADEPHHLSALDILDLPSFALPTQAEQPLGLTAQDRLTNLQRRIDRVYTDRLYEVRTQRNIAHFAKKAAEDGTPVDRTTSLTALRGGLDRRTVLIDLYAFDENTGSIGIHVVGISRQRSTAAVIHLDARSGTMKYADPNEPGRSLETPVWADRVITARALVQDDPGFRVATRDAVKAMQGSIVLNLGPFLEPFASSGCDHICLWPHGPLHFAPMQLMPVGDKLLADDWTITQVPSAGLLEPSAEPRRHARALAATLRGQRRRSRRVYPPSPSWTTSRERSPNACRTRSFTLTPAGTASERRSPGSIGYMSPPTAPPSRWPRASSASISATAPATRGCTPRRSSRWTCATSRWSPSPDVRQRWAAWTGSTTCADCPRPSSRQGLGPS